MKRITCSHPGTRIDMATVGPDWLGFVYFRHYATDECWQSYYGLKLLWCTFAFKPPASLQNLWSKPRAEWDGEL